MAFLLHQLLEETAQQFPKHEAVRFADEGVSYAELERRSNQLARTLLRLGVRRGDRVGILLHKSIESVIAVFGVMKAGACYVPLDPNSPSKRVEFIIDNCGIRVLITSPGCMEETVAAFSPSIGLKTLVIIEPFCGPNDLASLYQTVPFERMSAEDPGPVHGVAAVESDLAYILYTSGSTGDPKGVMITHRTILTFIDWACQKFELSDVDRVTSHAPLHFDLSTFDIYATVSAGGTIVLVPEELPVYPVRLVKLMQDERITVTYLVPSVLSMMVNYGSLDRHDLSQLRLILFAGEVFPLKYLRKLVKAVPSPDYYNLYGPTETNVCTYYKVRNEDLGEDRINPVPIGQACENMEVFVLDDEGELVQEPGRGGEVWVRGPCVALGYWGDEAKTAGVFRQNPIQDNFAEIAYRTGDIVSLSPDGVNWVYEGRRDHMIKSRGYRIELGEIETALYRHEDVQEAAVIAVPDELLGNRIRAYVVRRPEANLDPSALKQHMLESVPHYMVPESFELLDELPKTSTGKVNRPELASVSTA